MAGVFLELLFSVENKFLKAKQREEPRGRPSCGAFHLKLVVKVESGLLGEGELPSGEEKHLFREDAFLSRI